MSILLVPWLRQQRYKHHPLPFVHMHWFWWTHVHPIAV